MAVHLRRKGLDQQIASYGGELSYDPARMELRSATVPGEIVGLAHEPERGHVRFAGVKVGGIGETAVLLLVVSPRGRLTADAFGVQVTEVAEASSFRSLLPLVIAAAPPILEQ